MTTEQALLIPENLSVERNPSLMNGGEPQVEMPDVTPHWIAGRYLGHGALVLVSGNEVTLGSELDTYENVDASQHARGLPVLNIRGVGIKEEKMLRVLLEQWGQPVGVATLRNTGAAESTPKNILIKIRRDPTLGALLRVTGQINKPLYYFANGWIFNAPEIEAKNHEPRLVHLQMPSKSKQKSNGSKAPNLTDEELIGLEAAIINHILGGKEFEVPAGYVNHPDIVWSAMRAASDDQRYRYDPEASRRVTVLNRPFRSNQ